MTAKDPDDVANVLDLRQVTLSEPRAGRLRAEILTWDAWAISDLVAAGGPSGTVCLRVWTTRRPTDSPPNYLVCAAPNADGSRLRAAVLRDTGRGLPRRVASASVSGPADRRLVLGFALADLRSPAKLRFGLEAAQAAGCQRPRGCVDTAPDAPRSRGFTPQPVEDGDTTDG